MAKKMAKCGRISFINRLGTLYIGKLMTLSDIRSAIILKAIKSNRYIEHCRTHKAPVSLYIMFTVLEKPVYIVLSAGRIRSRAESMYSIYIQTIAGRRPLIFIFCLAREKINKYIK